MLRKECLFFFINPEKNSKVNQGDEKNAYYV